MAPDDEAVARALRHIDRAALLWEITGLAYLSAGEQAEQLGETALARFSIAYSMSAFARAEGIRATAELSIARTTDLGEEIVAALKRYDEECGEGET